MKRLPDGHHGGVPPRSTASPACSSRRHGVPWYVVALEVDGSRVDAIRLVINPDKLTQIGTASAL